MTTDQVIATASLGVGIVTLFVGGVIALAKVSFKLGAHAERLTKLESAAEKASEDRIGVQTHITQLAVMTEIMGGMKGDLETFMNETRRWKERVDDDIRGLLLGKTSPRRPD